MANQRTIQMDLTRATEEALQIAKQLLIVLEKGENNEDKSITSIGKQVISKIIDKKTHEKKKEILDNLEDRLNYIMNKNQKGTDKQNENSPLVKGNKNSDKDDINAQLFKRETFEAIVEAVHSAAQDLTSLEGSSPPKGTVGYEVCKYDARLQVVKEQLSEDDPTSGCCTLM